MAKNLSGELQVASANRLSDGVVVFLDDAGQWTPRLDRGAVARDKRGAEILLERAKTESASVVDPFLVAVAEDDDGRPRWALFRLQERAAQRGMHPEDIEQRRAGAHSREFFGLALAGQAGAP